MASHPRISIVLAAYQSVDVARTAVDHLLSFDSPDIELLLVDDGSTDGTADVFRSAQAADARVRVLEIETNRGVGEARRAGFLAARGTYIWNVDVDDEWPSDALARLLAAAESSPDLVLAAAERQHADGTRTTITPPAATTGEEALLALLRGELTGHLWNKLIRRDAIPESALSGARVHSDLIVVLGLLESARAVTAASAVVYRYLENPGSNIRSRRPRGDSIAEVELALSRAVEAVQVPSGPVRSFRARTVILSSLRDAVRADYSVEESAERFSRACERIRVADVAALVQAGDLKSAALLSLARLAPRQFRRLVGRRGQPRGSRPARVAG